LKLFEEQETIAQHTGNFPEGRYDNLDGLSVPVVSLREVCKQVADLLVSECLE
jgi:hypothetical protein